MTHVDETILLQIIEYLGDRLLTRQNYIDTVNKTLRQWQISSELDLQELAFEQMPGYLVYSLLNYGFCSDGEQALVKFLEAVHATADRQVKFDIMPWIEAINAVSRQSESGIKSIFISYSRTNADIVTRIVNRLTQVGHEVWLDKLDIKTGTPDWSDAIMNGIKSCSVFMYMASPLAAKSEYVKIEIAIAKDNNKLIIPLWIDGARWSDCATFDLVRAQNIDLREGDFKPGLEKLIYELSLSEPSGATITPEINIADEEQTGLVDIPRKGEIKNPYIGLNAFTENERQHFYGRDLMIGDFVRKLQSGEVDRFHAFVGASGSGKSSLIQAGILPALKEGKVEGSKNWMYLTMRPESDPVGALQGVLENHPDYRIDFPAYRRGANSLHNALLNFVSHLSGQTILLYIDQFEELFTQVTDNDLRDAFIQILINATQSTSSSLLIIVSMRADFLETVMEYPGLSELIFENMTQMKPVEVPGLLDIIRKPVESQGIRFHQNLATHILVDIVKEKTPLPLLQFTMQELFENRDKHLLTYGRYNEVRGENGAIARHAENICLRLASNEEELMARAVFLRLVDLNPNGTVTRKIVSLNSFLLEDSSDPRMLNIVNMFVEQRLLTVDSQIVTDDSDDGTRKETTVTISHESLTQSWPRFTGWISDYRDDVVAYGRILRAYQNWKHKEEEEQLLPKNLISEADALAKQFLIGSEELRYLRLSRVHQQKLEEIERQRKAESERLKVEAEQIRAEQEAERQRNLRRLRYIGTGLLATIFVFVIAFVVVLQRDNATLQDEAILLEAQIFWSVTRVPGLAGLPLQLEDLNQTPMVDFLATATSQAKLANSSPILIIEADSVTDNEMVFVPGGCFFMGSFTQLLDRPLNEPRQVCVGDYWIDRYEVSVGEVVDLVDRTGISIEAEYLTRNHNLPIRRISGNEAQAHCQARGGRLPTEVEWEYAARGPNSLRFTWGNIWQDGPFHENNDELMLSNVHRNDGTHLPDVSWIGAVNMNGNVSELARDVADNSDPVYTSKGAYFRDRLSEYHLLGQHEPIAEETSDYAGLGFRCVRDA